MFVSCFRGKLLKGGRDVRVTLSKPIPAKKKFDDPAAEGFRSRVFSPMGGFLEEEIRVIFMNGEDR